MGRVTLLLTATMVIMMLLMVVMQVLIAVMLLLTMAVGTFIANIPPDSFYIIAIINMTVFRIIFAVALSPKPYALSPKPSTSRLGGFPVEDAFRVREVPQRQVKLRNGLNVGSAFTVDVFFLCFYVFLILP